MFRRGAVWLHRFSPSLLVLIAIAILAGFCSYTASAFKPSTLVLEARTLQKGRGIVTVEKRYSRGSVSRGFKIQDDQGLKKMIVIELPASNLESIRIAPLGPDGQFSLDRIILSNGTASYFWDAQGRCSRRALHQGILKREACDSGSPRVTTNEDASVVISSLPEMESVNPIRTRMAVALTFVIGVIVGGIWLLGSRNNKSADGSWKRHVVQTSWLALAVLFVYQLHLVYTYSVDIPFEDGWDYFKASSLSQDLSWRWLTSFHVEDRIIMTRLLAWLNLKLFGLDFDLQEVLNMLIFGGLLATLVGFKNRVAGRGNFQFFPLFLIFLLSTIAVENHLWSFQSMYHLVLLFSIAALYHAYSLKMTCSSACAFSLFMLLAMSTFSAWVVFAVVYLLCISVYIAAGIAGGRIERLAGWRFLLIGGSTIMAGLLLYYHGYVTPAWPPPKLYPTDIRFWEYYLNIVSFGFGFELMQGLPGAVCLLFAICPLLLLLGRKETRWLPSTWQVLTAILSILAVLAAITLGRGNFGEPKTSRYSEFGMMLIPLTALAWWLVFKEGRKLKAILLSLWIMCFAGYFNDWSTQKYAESKQIELYNLECVEGYFAGIGNGVCQGRTTPFDLDRAKAMGAKFTRQFLSNRGGGR